MRLDELQSVYTGGVFRGIHAGGIIADALAGAAGLEIPAADAGNLFIDGLIAGQVFGQALGGSFPVQAFHAPLRQLVAFGALQEFHEQDGALGVLALLGDKGAGPADAIVVVHIGGAAVFQCQGGGERRQVGINPRLVVLGVKGILHPGGTGGREDGAGQDELLPLRGLQSEDLLGEVAFLQHTVQQHIEIEQAGLGQAEANSAGFINVNFVGVGQAHHLGKGVFPAPGGQVNLHVGVLLLHHAEDGEKVLKGLQRGVAQIFHDVVAIEEDGAAVAGQHFRALPIGVRNIVGFESIVVAVIRGVVHNLDGVYQRGELGRVLGDELIPRVADVGILETGDEIFGENEVGEHVGSQ